MKKSLIVVGLSLMIFMGLASLVEGINIGNKVWDLNVTLVNQRPDPVEPGQNLELRFKFENSGNAEAKDVVVELIPQYPFSLTPGESSSQGIGSLQGRQLDDVGKIVKFRLQVDDGAVAGKNEIELRYKINDEGSIGWIKLEPFTVDVETHDAIIAVTSVASIPKSLVPGQAGILTLKLKNTADSLLKDIRAKLEVSTTAKLASAVATTEYPFSPIGSANEKVIEQLDAGASGTLSFHLVADPGAEANVYRVPLTLSYSDELARNYTKNLIVGLVVGEEPDLIVHLEDTTLVSRNKKGTVTIKFVNKGTSNIKFGYVRLGEQEGITILSSPEVYIGKIDSDDYESVDFDLYVESKASEVLLPLTVTYKDAHNSDFEEAIKIPLTLYSSSEAKKYGIAQAEGGVGFLLIILIVGAGLGFYWWRQRKKKRKLA